MEIQEIDNVKIPFDRSWNNIAISLSGGADSAILAYILCGFIPKDRLGFKINIISHIRMWKTKPWQGYDSQNVYQYLVNNFPHISFKRHTNFISPELEWGSKGPTIIDEYGKLVSGDNVEIRAFAEYVGYQENIDAYYNAVSRNPKNVDFKGMITRDIDPNSENQHLTIMKHLDKWAIHPFRFVEKSWVIKQYYRLNVLDLLDITRSCEGEFEGLDYKSYIPGQPVPTCDKCFWCNERTWAIEEATNLLRY